MFDTDEYVKKLNDYVGLASTKSNATWVKSDMFLVLFLALIYFGNSLLQNFNLFTSWWMIFVVFVIAITIWGIFLLLTLEKRQLDFLLYHGIVGMYLSVEFFSIGFSYGQNIAHFDLWILILLIALDIPLLIWIIWFRREKFKEIHRTSNTKQKQQSVNPLQALFIPILLIFTPIFIQLSKGLSKNVTYTVMTIVSIFLGYAMSIYFVYICNYVVAKKYEKHIYLYENGIIQKGQKKDNIRQLRKGCK